MTNVVFWDVTPYRSLLSHLILAQTQGPDPRIDKRRSKVIQLYPRALGYGGSILTHLHTGKEDSSL
jgi:hypothetical protein